MTLRCKAKEWGIEHISDRSGDLCFKRHTGLVPIQVAVYGIQRDQIKLKPVKLIQTLFNHIETLRSKCL